MSLLEPGVSEAPPAVGRRDAALALLLALASGILFAWQSLGVLSDNGLFSKYARAAVKLGHGWPIGERLLDYSPLYLAVYRAAYSLSPEPFRGVLLLQAAWLGLAVAFLYLAVRRHAGPLAALAAAAALALERSVAVHAYIFEPEALLLCCLAAWLLLAQLPGRAAAGGAGIALALASLTRPGLLPLVLVVPAAALLRAGPRRPALVAGALGVLPVALALGWLSARNHAAAGTWSPVVMNPGTVFYEGNNPYALGFGASYPLVVNDVAAAQADESDFQHVVYRRLARVDAGRDLGVGAVNAFWATKALCYLADEPGAALRRAGRKILYAFHRYRWYDIPGAEQAEDRLRTRGVPATPLALVSALALVGAVTGLRRRQPCMLPAYALFAGQLVVLVVTYASARQRLALLPALCLFAALGASRVARVGRGAALAAAATVALAVLFSRETDLMRDHAEEVRPGSATVAAPQDADPKDARARFHLALRLINEGELGRAEALFESLRRERYRPQDGEPAYYLGRIAALRGRREDAVRFMREALAGSPGHPGYLAQLAALTGERRWSERISRYLDGTDAQYELGWALLDNGRAPEAAALLGRVVAAAPEDEAARRLLAQASGAAAGARIHPEPAPP
jgi:tetratricopeptide (TPR) repeat protein